jgi:hypothetical protein
MNEKNEIDMSSQYMEVAADEERNREAAEWDVFLGDGLDETNEYKIKEEIGLTNKLVLGLK